jgi:serine/threonine protein kinase
MKDDRLRQRTREIGNAALEFEPGPEREAFIAHECGDDAELKARVVGYVTGAERIGRWTLERKLGEGGLGIVYLASRSDGEVRQRGAIKFLRGSVSSHSLELRFCDERQILANLHHPTSSACSTAESPTTANRISLWSSFRTRSRSTLTAASGSYL